MKVKRRRTWRNHSGNQRVEPLRIYHPESLADIIAIVREAEESGCTVRAVGSGHSWSDVALTTGFLIETRRLNHVLPMDHESPRSTPRAERLIRVEAGMRIRKLNDELFRRGLALSNMGGYDGQTVAGVMSTSTHGSGMSLGPLNACVRSIDLVVSGGRLVRIEPNDGITDRARFEAAYPAWTLHQDDAWFDAVSVGMGCMGVIYAMTLAVDEAFWLEEARYVSTWEVVRAELARGEMLQKHRHYEVYLNPYSLAGKSQRCLVTTRDVCPKPGRLPKHRLRRNVFTQLSAVVRVLPWVLNHVFDAYPRLTPRALDLSLQALADTSYVDRSYRVLNIGAPNHIPAYSAEIGIPVDGSLRHLAAIDLILATAARFRDLGLVYHTAPVALRFVQKADAYLSMMHGQATMMIELILMADTEGGAELLRAYEETFYALAGRPHWGQINYLAGGDDFLTCMYPKYAKWLEIHRQLNASRVFDSPFAKRVGITRSVFVP